MTEVENKMEGGKNKPKDSETKYDGIPSVLPNITCKSKEELVRKERRKERREEKKALKNMREFERINSLKILPPNNYIKFQNIRQRMRYESVETERLALRARDASRLESISKNESKGSRKAATGSSAPMETIINTTDSGSGSIAFRDVLRTSSSHGRGTPAEIKNEANTIVDLNGDFQRYMEKIMNGVNFNTASITINLKNMISNLENIMVNSDRLTKLENILDTIYKKICD